ncbi:MAG: hypothetical protein ABSG93_00055 [Solirubrobacteraceae bacterium]|jgi:hypothetical protein
MGLLDEAIREHLELKRRRGADPSAVARAEREALAPVFSDEEVGDGVEVPVGAPELDQRAAAEAVPAQPSSSEDARLASFSALDQATAELDMQAVLDGDSDAIDEAGAPSTLDEGQTLAAASGAASAEDLEWDFSGERDAEPAAEDVPGQERLSFE